VVGHENASTALGSRALSSQARDLAAVLDLVVLEHAELDFLALLLQTLGAARNFCGAQMTAARREQSVL
jgi:hypothetical protein